MPRHALAVGWLLVPALALAVPVPKSRKPDLLAKHWGTPVDPDRDCQFRPDGGRLRIVLPGKAHIMSAEIGKTNSPRVLRPVAGDFRAEVTVGGRFPSDPRSLVENRWAFYGAGLLVWLDGKNYARLERARIHYPDGRWRCYPNWELRQDGRVARPGGVKDGVLDETKPVRLRLTRKGTTLTAAYSQDGKTWKELPPIEVEMGKKIRVGVVADQNTPSGYEAVFEGLRVTATRPARK